MDDTEKAYMMQLNSELNELKGRNSQLNEALSSASYSQQEEGNLIQYQLDVGDLLEMIEHFLRGDKYTVENGRESWKKQDNDDLVIFNEYGVSAIMLIIGQYVNRNTMLSCYTEERINEILADLGDELAFYIFNNYEKMGMITEYKRSRFPLTVLTILHIIESAYRRAIGGRTSEDLNTSKIFTQSDILRAPNKPMMPLKKKFNLFRPGTW